MTGQGLFLVVSTFENDSIASVHKHCQFIDSLMWPRASGGHCGRRQVSSSAGLGETIDKH